MNFFNWEAPDPKGVHVELKAKNEDGYGHQYDIYVDTIPHDVKIIRMKLS